jgi:hypothetical protein
MQTICVKIDDDVYQELEKLRGDDTKSVYYRKIIDSYLRAGEYQDIQKVYEQLKIEYDKVIAVQVVQKDRIDDLQKQLGFLQLEYQRMSKMNEQLLLSPSHEEITKKSWWKFWKK